MRKGLTGEARSWSLIGPGSVGGELARQLREKPEVAARLGLEQLPRFVLRRSGLYHPARNSNGGFDIEPDGRLNGRLEESDFGSWTEIVEGLDDFPEVIFVCIPSESDGHLAYTLISDGLKRSRLVVTAEKGAMANYFTELKEESNDFKRLGIDATVGGGTHLISATELYCRDLANVSQIHLALNGTLTAIFSSIAPPGSAGMTLGQAVDQAKRLGFAEPGAQNAYDVIRGEAEGDVPKKVSILFNALGLSETPINWHDLKFSLEDDEIDRAIQDAAKRRFIVSIYPEQFQEEPVRGPEEDIIGHFSLHHDGWQIVAGFRDTTRNPLFFPLARLTGPGNGAVIGLGPNESDGAYSAGMGPGAGPGPTVNTMLDDYIEKFKGLA